MEKIREALAKARMDKSFREQHPVVGEGRDGAPHYEFNAGKQAQDPPQFENPATNDKIGRLPTEASDHDDGWKSAAIDIEMATKETPDQELDIDPLEPSSTAVTENAPTASSPSPMQSAAVAEQPVPTASLQPVTTVEYSEDKIDIDALPQDASGVVRGRFWTGRKIICSVIAAAFVAALVVGVVVHNFFHPLNAYFDWLYAVYSGSIEPQLNQLFEWVSRAWMDALDRIRELAG